MNEVPTSTPRSWEDIVAAQPATMAFLPEGVLEEAKAWHAERIAFQTLMAEFAKKENLLSNQFANLSISMRKAFEAAGREDAWITDIGFEEGALKEGKFVVNFSPARRA